MTAARIDDAGANTGQAGSACILAPVLTLAEACAFLKISKPTMFALLQRREIPGKKVGRCWRFEREVLLRWLRVTSRCSGSEP